MGETKRKRSIDILAAVIILYAGLIMLNWITGSHILDFADRRWIGMVFNTALLFMILTIANLLKNKGGRAAQTADLIVVGVALFSAAATLQYVTGWDMGIDQLFVKTEESHVSSVRPGSMAPLTGLNFILLSLVILIHSRVEEKRFQQAAGILLSVVFSIGIFILCGRVLGSPELGNIPGQTSMAATTAVVFLLQVLLCFLVYPELILNRLNDSGNFKMLIGRGIPILLVVPMAVQMILLDLENQRRISDVLGHSMFAAFFIICSLIGLVYLAGLIHKSELKVREANEKYNRFFSLSKDYLLIVRTDGQAVAVNAIWSETLGWTHEELLGKNMKEFLSEREQEQGAKNMDLLAGGEERAVQRISITGKDGERRIVEWDFSQDPSTELVYCIGRDITLQHEIEYRQAQARHLAEQASRAKSDFLANMSHELRTPLNSIIGFTEILGDRLYGELNDRQQEYIGYIDQSSRHLLNLINDVLDLSKIEAGKMMLDLQWCSVRQLVESALMMFREKCYRGGIALSAAYGSDHNYMMEIDERKVKQVLYNLLSNGVKFTGTGGRVTVIVEEINEGVTQVLALTVEDTGDGIPEEQQTLLFTKFHQAETVYDKIHEGTGLGLALTKELVELHGGSIQVRSCPGNGSRFTVHLPIKTYHREELEHGLENTDSGR